ncbi:MAG: hypothetical protein Q8Q42_03835 [Nanoarchaeota archaeon]|nr:hypothetical protein [Nanoarchaeota archaeon]
MSLKNKIRNFQIFGLSNYLPKKTHKIMLIIILIGISFVAGKIIIDDTPTTTGLAVDDATEELNTKELLPVENTKSIEDTTDKPDYEVYDYYEYGGECSYNIKKAEDDVNDIISYIDNNEQKYKDLEKEYNDLILEYTKKLEILKENYEPRIQSAKEETEINQKDLNTAQERLQELQKSCAF